MKLGTIQNLFSEFSPSIRNRKYLKTDILQVPLYYQTIRECFRNVVLYCVFLTEISVYLSVRVSVCACAALFMWSIRFFIKLYWE